MQFSKIVSYRPRPGATAGIRIVSPFGSESDGESAGIAHFVEHTIFKGTKKIPLDRFNRLSERLGYFNAYTDYSRVSYHCTCLHDNIRDCLSLLTEMVGEAAFPDAEIERERGVILQELEEWKSNPNRWFWQNALSSLLGKRLGHFQAGTTESVKAITPDQIREWHAKYLIKGPAIVLPSTLSVGAIDGYSIQPRTEFTLPEWDFANIEIHHPTKQAMLGVFSKGIRFAEDAKTSFASDVACEILGGGRQSRLHNELREKRGLCYSAGASSSCYEGWGFYGITTRLAPESLAEAEEIISKQAGLISVGDFDDEEFQTAKDRTALRYALSWESTEGHVRVADMVFEHIPWMWSADNPVALVVQEIQNLTRTNIIDAAEKAWGENASIKRVRMLPE